MTYEEALNRLLNSEMPKDKTQRDYDALCLTAIEKQIPKKPIWETIGGHNAYICPFCNQHYVNNDSFCGNCGQAIDWSEEE